MSLTFPITRRWSRRTPEQATQLAGQRRRCQAVLPYEPYYKLDAALLPCAVEQQPQTNAVERDDFSRPARRGAGGVERVGGAIDRGRSESVWADADCACRRRKALAAIAQLPLAQEIEAYTPRRLLNDLTRVQMGVATNTLTNTSNYLNLSGSNVTVNINDTGVDSTHPDFTGAAGSLLAGW